MITYSATSTSIPFTGTTTLIAAANKDRSYLAIFNQAADVTYTILIGGADAQVYPIRPLSTFVLKGKSATAAIYGTAANGSSAAIIEIAG